MEQDKKYLLGFPIYYSSCLDTKDLHGYHVQVRSFSRAVDILSVVVRGFLQGRHTCLASYTWWKKETRIRHS